MSEKLKITRTLVWLFLQVNLADCFTLNEVKLEFLLTFIKDEHAKIDLYLPSWNLKEQHVLFRQSAKLLTVQYPNLRDDESIKIFDFLLSQNSSLIPADTSKKIILISFDTKLDFIYKGFKALPSRNVFLARFLPLGDTFVVKVSHCYQLEGSRYYEDYLLTWKPAERLSVNLDTLKRKRVNFNGMRFPVGIVLSNAASLQHLDDFREQWTDTYSKSNYGPIINMLAYFNISAEWKVFSDYKHLETTAHQYLLTVTVPYISKDILQFVDVLKVTPPTKLCFILRRPPTSFVTTIFTVTFTAPVWYATLGLLGLLILALYFFLNIETKRQNLKGQVSFSGYDLMLIGLEAICQQGTSTDPSSYASRILQVFMFLAFMFLYVAYSANILVLLQSTRELTDRNQLLQYGVNFAGMNTSAFNYYSYEVSQRIFQNNTNASVLYSIEEGMARVRQGIFAFYLESRYGSMYSRAHFSDYEVCGLQEFEAKYDFGLGYAAIAKNSGYYELFKIALLQITEQGFAARHYLRYFQKPACYSQGSSFDTIGIREIYQAIVLVAIGVSAGLIVLAIEHTLSRVGIKRLPDLVKQ